MAINSPNEGFFERAGKKVDRSVDYAERKYNQAKETVSKGIDNATNFVNKKAEQGINAVKNGLNVLGNTYRDVSNKISQKVNAVKDGAIKAIDNGTERATNQLKQLDGALKNIEKSVKDGTLKAIRRSAKTGTMMVMIGNEVVTYTINSVKRDIATVSSVIKNKTIEGVTYAKQKGMLISKTGEKTLQVSVAAAIAAGLAVYKGGRLVINKANLAINTAKQTVEGKARTVANAVKQGVNQGKTEAAKFAHNIGNRLDPNTRYVAVR